MKAQHLPRGQLQRSESDCAITALENALRLLGLARGRHELQRRQASLNLRIGASGWSAAAVGAVAADLGVKVAYHTDCMVLRELERRLDQLDRLRETMVVAPTRQTRALVDTTRTLMSLGGQIVIRSENTTPIMALPQARAVGIARVTAEEFYGLVGEKWCHYVAIKRQRPDRLSLVDSYRVRGRLWYGAGWARCVEHADRFNWRTWRNDLLILRMAS